MEEHFTERRVTNRVCEYWNSLKRDDSDYPRGSDIEKDDIVDLLPYCVLVDISTDGDVIHYKTSHVGEAIQRFYDEGMFSDTDVPFVSPRIDTFKEYLDELFESGREIVESSETLNMHQEEVKFRQCLLPLGDKDGKITGVLAALNCKSYK